MAITFDAPSANWQYASILTTEPRVDYPIPQNTTAIFYEVDVVINEGDFFRTSMDTVMADTSLDGGITSATTTVTVDSTTGFPHAGEFKIASEVIPYTGRTATTFTGCNVVGSHSDGVNVYSVAYLVEETSPRKLGGEMVEFTRRYATVPDAWVDYSEAVFQFPGYYSVPADSNYRAPQNLNATIKTTADYALTTNPETDLPVANQMFRSIDSGEAVLNKVDDTSTPTYTVYTGYVSGSTYIYAAQSTLERFAGNVWVRYQHQTVAQ